MSVLINSQANVFTNEQALNQLLHPVRVGAFALSDEAKQFIDNDLTDHNANWLFNYVPQAMLEFCEEHKLIPTKASIFKTQPQDASQARSAASQTPHINAGNEVHFFFAGSHIIYFNINDEHFSLIVQAGDWLFIPADVEHWIKATADQYLVIASYHSEPFDLFHSKVTYTTTKSQAFL